MNRQADLNGEKAATGNVACTLQPQLIDAFKQTLLDLTLLYQHALAETLAEREAVVSNDVELLNEITQNKGRLARQISNLETRRQSLIAQLGSPPLSLQDLASRFDLTTADEFRRIRASLEEIIRKLSLENKLNQRLMDSVLRSIRYTREAFIKARDSLGLGYSAPGQPAAINRPLRSSLLNRKI